MAQLLRNLVLIAGCAVFAGMALNLLVEVANNGYMPVMLAGCPPGMRFDDMHVCASAGTRLVFLCDYIRVGNDIQSPGDLAVGYGILIGIPSTVLWALVLAAQKVWAFCKMKAL